MHRNGGSMEGKGSVGRMGYRRDFRQSDRGGFGNGAGPSGTQETSVSPASKNANPQSPQRASGVEGAAAFDLEKRLNGVQQDFSQELRKISEKENEKFDLIFAILSELQTRQASLEDSVRSLKQQYSGNQMVASATGPAAMPQQQQGQFIASGANNQAYGQIGGQMGSPMGGSMGNMNGQQPMQQFTGVMQPDGTQAMFTAVPQLVVVSSPTGGGMPYAMPQMMSPAGPMQPMQQVAMQFISQPQSPQDMAGGFPQEHNSNGVMGPSAGNGACQGNGQQISPTGGTWPGLDGSQQVGGVESEAKCTAAPPAMQQNMQDGGMPLEE